MFKLLLLFLMITVVGCGGGDSPSSTPTTPTSTPNVKVPTYLIVDNTLRMHQVNDVLTYNTVANSQFSDGSGAFSASGVTTEYIYLFLPTASLPLGSVTEVSDFTSKNGTTATVNQYFYDVSGNYMHYTVSNAGYYTNQLDPYSGTLFLPVNIFGGQSWSNNSVFMPFDGTNYTGTNTFMVITQEIISVPFGKVETYKISYTATLTEAGIFAHKLRISGTIWFHPKIGIVKSDVVAEVRFAGFVENFLEVNELVSINWIF